MFLKDPHLNAVEKTNFFLQLERNISIISTFLIQDLKIQVFFLFLEDDHEHIWNKPTFNRKITFEMFSEKADLYYNKFLFLFDRMQCCPNKRIYIRALSQHSHKKRKDFLLIFLTVVSRMISEIERNV